jgi:proline dehydrogenase
MSIESNSRRRTVVPISVLLLLLSGLIYWFGEAWSRHTLLYLSKAGWARRLVSGLPIARQVARRFVAGETLDEAVNVARELNAQGMHVTIDYLGERVTNKKEAEVARTEILRLYDRISVKLTQLGLNLDARMAFENVLAIAEKARATENFLRIDMEDSPLVDATLDIQRRLRFEHGLDNVGVVIQAYLYRSEADVVRLIDEGTWVRLCKGAYLEPEEVAFPDKSDTDRNFVKLMQILLGEEARRRGVYLGVATHDEVMITATKDFARREHIGRKEFEFQMLYGIRRELQTALVSEGYRCRIYVPYGTAWYPYFVRRLAERPANVWFFLSNLLRA